MSQKLESRAAYEASVRAFFHRQYLEKPVPVPAGTSLAGQCAVVTGANAGLGLESSRQLLGLGLSRLIVAVRSQSKGEAAAQQLRAEFPGADISVWLLDMLSYASVQAFARRCDAELPRLDIALLNAGMQNGLYHPAGTTPHEMTFQTNYLSTALLALLLLPVLKAKGAGGAGAGRKPPVLTLVGSDTSYYAKIDTASPDPIAAQFDAPEKWGPHVYWNSKLCVNWLVAQLAELVSPRDVLVNVVSPGLTGQTDFANNMIQDRGCLVRALAGVVHVTLARSVKVGASTYIDAAVVKGSESHGSFVSDWTIKPFPQIMYTEEGKRGQAKLWEETLKELEFANVSQIVKEL